MRKRNIAIITRLNRREQQHLKNLVKKSGLSQEAYIRHLINGVVPVEAPSADYYAMMKELHAVGNNLNQIARKAHQLNVVDVQQYDQAVKEFEKAVTKITEAVILPKSMKF
ncbi:plasmid mobilization protein [[Eubacterium] hominis]|uniref:plasmid mobilization protein n=1 Tax=[Eubacterium] hominis TaxID=2764325 RepID=UPI003A4DE2CC